MWIYSAAPIVGLLSLVGTVILAVAAIFPGKRLKRLKLSGVMFALFVACLFVGEPPLEVIAANEATAARTKAEEIQGRQMDTLDGLRGHIDFLKAFDAGGMTEDVSSILLAIELLSLPAKDLYETESLDLSPETKEAVEELHPLLVRTQIRALPALRDAYGPALRKALWEEDGSAKTFGAGFRTIDIVHPAFAANRNIKSFHRDTATVLAKLRFTRVNYKWIKNPTEFSYFSLEPPKDSELVIWRENGRFVRLKPIAEGG